MHRFKQCWPVVLLLAVVPSARAQQVTANSGIVPMGAMSYGNLGDQATSVTPATPLPVGGKQETLMLISANVPATAQSLWGGNYVFTQMCSAYGTVKLQVLGPDGTSWLDILSRTVSDTAGTGVALGSAAIVRATATSTTGCSAQLARVP